MKNEGARRTKNEGVKNEGARRTKNKDVKNRRFEDLKNRMGSSGFNMIDSTLLAVSNLSV